MWLARGSQREAGRLIVETGSDPRLPGAIPALMRLATNQINPMYRAFFPSEDYLWTAAAKAEGASSSRVVPAEYNGPQFERGGYSTAYFDDLHTALCFAAKHRRTEISAPKTATHNGFIVTEILSRSF